MKRGTILTTSIATLALGAGMAISTLSFGADQSGATDQIKTIKGEIVDLMCYLDHGAKGDKHKGCASKCIQGGGPVGLLSGDDLYLVVGDHQPINEQLAPKAAQTITLKGKVVQRNGVKMISNATLVE